MSEAQRLFVAVFPPPAAQAAVAGAIEALRKSAPPGRVSWVRAENLHFTLRFLGQCDAVMVAAARRALAAVASTAPFEARLEGYGAFPRAARASALWLGMGEGSQALVALAAALEAALAAEGFGPADKPFVPHLTFGRVRAAADWSRPLAAAPPVGVAFRVERVALVRSTLSQGGSRYEWIAETELQGVTPQ